MFLAILLSCYYWATLAHNINVEPFVATVLVILNILTRQSFRELEHLLITSPKGDRSWEGAVL